MAETIQILTVAETMQKLAKLGYRVRTFAALIDRSERFVKQEIYDGNLKALKKGRDWLIPAEAAIAYLSLEQEGDDRETTNANQ